MRAKFRNILHTACDFCFAFFTLRENHLNFCTKMTTRSKTLATLLIKSEGYMLKPRFKKGTYLRHSTTCEVAFNGLA